MAKRALIVIDVQNEYFDGALPISDPPPDAEPGQHRTGHGRGDGAGVPVIVVRHGSTDAGVGHLP